jgi:hypothetical protein
MATLEEVLDKLVADIQDLADTDYADGGFRDEMPLGHNVWWGEAPEQIPNESYPTVEVVPVRTEPAGGTTHFAFRDLTIRVTLLYAPTAFFDGSETSEQTAQREAVRTMDAIERYLEKTSKRMLDGLARSAVVGATDYAPLLPRGTMNVRSASATIDVQIQRPLTS